MALNASAERGAIQAQQDDATEHWPSLPTPLGIERSSLSSIASSLPSPQSVPKTPERLAAAAIPLESLETIQRIEINETHVRDDVTYFVFDVFLRHFDTRLSANLNYLRRAALHRFL